MSSRSHGKKSSDRVRLILPASRALGLPYKHVTRLALLAFLSGLASAAVLVLVVQVGLRVTTGSSPGPILMGIDLDRWSANELFAGALVAAVLVVVVDLLAAGQSSRIVASVQLNLRTSLFNAYNNADWVTQNADPPGHLQDLMATNVSRALNLTGAINGGVVALLTLVTMVVSATLISPVTTGAIVAVLIVLLAVLSPLARRIQHAAEDLRATNLTHSIKLAEVAGVPTEVRTFGVSAAVAERHAASATVVANEQARLTWLEKAIPSFQRNLALVTILGTLAVVRRTDAAEVAALGTVVVLLARSLTYAHALQQVVNKFAAAGPFVIALENETTRYSSTHRNRPRPTPATSDLDLRRDAEGPILSVERVTYRHPTGATPTIDDVSIDILKGDFVALVGASGSGKTTLAEIMLGLRRPEQGQVRANGVDIATIDPPQWSEWIAMVPQRPAVISGTIAENVRFLRSGLTDGDVERALSDAGMRDELATGRLTLDTDLAPGSRALSGGQLQRLAIARALVGKPAVIVMDEPTSALDPSSEQAISSTLRALSGSVTLIVIAHRGQTIAGCDRVIEVDSGRIVDRRNIDRKSTRVGSTV